MTRQRQITGNGRKNFGRWVESVRQSEEVSIIIFQWMKNISICERMNKYPTQSQFARWLSAETRILISEGMINRLETGKYKSAPPVEVLAALREVGLLCFGGKPCSILEMMAVLLEELTPKTSQPKREGDG